MGVLTRVGWNLRVLTDPSESRSLTAENPEQLASMMEGMVHELESMGAVYPLGDGNPLEPAIPSSRR